MSLARGYIANWHEMTPEEWEKVSELYHEASELEGDARAKFLDEKCLDNETLRLEVESLLAAGSEAGDFITEPVAGAFAADLLQGNGIAPGDAIGHYRVLSKIGTGGMGEVFLAADTTLGRKVAIKTLSPIFDGDVSFLKRFRNEARAAARLNHPHVATVYAVDEHAGRPLIALEHIDGKTLGELIPEGGVDVDTFARWFYPVAAALAHAHDRGVIHRDVKPSNIMITTDGIVKILDFGLAYFRRIDASHPDLHSDLTQPGQFLGTPSYMSPEQAEGKDVDHRSDIFSLGVVMYEAITGERPFRGDSNAEIVSNLLKTTPPAIEKIRPSVPPELAELIMRCMQKRRRDRPDDMAEIRSVIAGFVPVTRSVPTHRSFSQRFYRQVRSDRLWPGFASAGVVLLLALAGWYLFSGRGTDVPGALTNMAIRRLSQTNNVVFAAITPDGKSVVYNTIDENGNRALWIRRVEDRNALQLLPYQPVQFWGGLTTDADSGQIYYINADRASVQSTLYRVSALGGSPRKLADGVNDLGSLTADGKRIIFVRYLPRLRIVSANAEDGSDERVIREEDFGTTVFRDPQLSADERFIYYSRMDKTDGIEWWKLVRIPVEGGEETVIIPSRREKLNEIAVLADGRGLLLNAVDPTSNLSQLFYLSLSNGKLTRLTNDINNYFGISVDKAGRSIVAAQRYNETRIWVGDVDGLDRSEPVTPEPNVHRYAVWTPDGRIVYDAVDNSRPHVWIMNGDGSGKQQLTPNDSSDTHPSVSPDGQYIVFTSNRNGTDQVWRMNVDGSNQTLLAKVDGSTSAPRFGPDGQTVYFYWAREGLPVMGRMSIHGGEVTELNPFSESEWALSPDGSRMAYVLRDEVAGRTKLAIIRMDSPTPDVILDSSPVYLLEWRPDGKAVYVRERDKGTNPYATIVEYDLTTGKERVFFSAAPDTVLDLSFSSDGKRAAIVRRRLLTDAVILTATNVGE